VPAMPLWGVSKDSDQVNGDLFFWVLKFSGEEDANIFYLLTTKGLQEMP
jgi:hypothetical protein